MAFCFLTKAVVFLYIFSKKIWQFNFLTATLRQFFVIHLSRKAEGNGPMTPWQPKMF
jgi:hypothetical protein